MNYLLFSAGRKMNTCNYFTIPTNLKGNSIIPLMILKTRSMVSPTILNGRRMSHNSGKRKIITSANGQQTINNKHHRTIASKVFILIFLKFIIKIYTKFKFLLIETFPNHKFISIFVRVHRTVR